MKRIRSQGLRPTRKRNTFQLTVNDYWKALLGPSSKYCMRWSYFFCTQNRYNWILLVKKLSTSNFSPRTTSFLSHFISDYTVVFSCSCRLSKLAWSAALFSLFLLFSRNAITTVLKLSSNISFPDRNSDSHGHGVSFKFHWHITKDPFFGKTFVMSRSLSRSRFDFTTRNKQCSDKISVKETIFYFLRWWMKKVQCRLRH